MPDPRARWVRLRSSLVVLLVFSSALAAAGTAGATDTEPAETTETTETTEGSSAAGDVLPGEVVVETTDPTIDTTSRTYLAALQDLRAEQRLLQALTSRYVDTGTAAAVTGDIAVTYVRSTPSDVRAVVDAAIRDWNTTLRTTSSGPVVVSFDWVDLSDTLPGTLGFAGPTGFVRRADNLYYPVSLANTLDRRDYAPSRVEIEVTISSAFYNTDGGWYVDASDERVPFNRLDLYATVLHELGHGLGFLGSAERRDGVNLLQVPPDKFDTLVQYRGSRLVDLANNGAYLTSGELFVDIGGGQLHELYAPRTFYNGSSFSHFDETEYRNGDPGSLMTPALGAGETERVIDAPTLGVLVQSGWQTDVPMLTPSITEVGERSGAFDVSWSTDLGENAVPPQSWAVRVVRTSNGQQAARVVTSGSARTARVSGLTNNVNYRVEVSPIGFAASPGTATQTLSLTPPPVAPTLVNVAGSGFDRTVRWQLTDDGGSPLIRHDVQMSKNGGSFVSLGSTTATEMATGRLTNDVFQFRVQAVNANGGSAYGYSLPVGFTTTVVRPLPLDGEIARLYQAYFDRIPDRTGMDFYLDQRSTGRSLSSVSQEFLDSTEFSTIYGSLDNRAFVEQLYRNVLGRRGDTGGINFWTDQLNGGRSRSSVVIEFAQSSEFVTRTDTAAVQTSNQGAIYRLYLAYFLRPADVGGAAFWTQEANSGRSLTSISNAFARSPEFSDRYGDLSDAAFIELVYANVLGRVPDSAGRSFWLGRMAGGVSRGDVMLAFSDSPEFVVRTGSVR